MTQTVQLNAARAVGQVGQLLALDRAERDAPGFMEAAEAAVMARLLDGPASAETLTEHAKANGVKFRDGRAMGPVYRSMRDRGLIRIVGDCARRHGHGSSGGHIWERCA